MKRYNSIILFRFVAFVTIIAAVSVTMVSGDDAADIQQAMSKCKGNPQCDANCQKSADACTTASGQCSEPVCKKAASQCTELVSVSINAKTMAAAILTVCARVQVLISANIQVDIKIFAKVLLLILGPILVAFPLNAVLLLAIFVQVCVILGLTVTITAIIVVVSALCYISRYIIALQIGLIALVKSLVVICAAVNPKISLDTKLASS